MNQTTSNLPAQKAWTIIVNRPIHVIRMAVFYLLVLLGLRPVSAQVSFDMFTGSNHPELEWQTLRTEHFEIHFHQGLEETARDCADIAEQVYEPITRQLGVAPRGLTHLAITDVDEISNGFAIGDQIKIWVRLNDYIRHFSLQREWLHFVIAHEFQHVVANEATRDWRGKLLGRILSGAPKWWFEGLAEFYTENWNIFRSDEALRQETLDERLEESNAHDAGYAKVLYLAWRDGDSTLVKICKWRSKVFGTYSFDRAFKEVTGQDLEQFEAEWKRVMNGLYNSELALCEPLESIGKRIVLPLDQVDWMAMLPDSSAWVAVGKDSLLRKDRALYRVSCDSLQSIKLLAEGNLLERAALSPDGNQIVFARSSTDRYGSWNPDLWTCPTDSRRERRLTRGEQAYEPAFSSDGTLAYIASSGGQSRLMLLENGIPRELWNPGPEWEMLQPAFSPDGKRVALCTDDPFSRRRITVLDVRSGSVQHLSSDYDDERNPVWVSDSLIMITAFADYRPNLFLRSLSGNLERVTDSGEGVSSMGDPGMGAAGLVVAMALDSARTSRPLLVDPSRRATRTEIRLKPRYTDWREEMPGIRVPEWDRDEHTPILSTDHYNSLRIRPNAALLLPVPDGGFGTIFLSDPLVRNRLQLFFGYSSQTPGFAAIWQNFSNAWTTALKGSWNTEIRPVLLEDELLWVGGSSLSLEFSYDIHPRGLPYETLQLGLGTRIEDRELHGSHQNSPASLFHPRDSRSGLFASSISWRSNPLEVDEFWWPTWSHGIQLQGSIARPWIFGEESVDYWRATLYRIQPLPSPALKLFLQARLEALTGQRKTWRALGVGTDPVLEPSILMSGDYASLPWGTASSLRALDRTVAGDCVFTSTAELRVGLLGAPDLVEVLGVGNSRIVLAPFLDLGRVADRKRLSPLDREAQWLWTSGIEAQIGIRIADFTIATIGIGLGGEGADWIRSGKESQTYWRINVGRPF
jgi:hypothetical protein